MAPRKNGQKPPPKVVSAEAGGKPSRRERVTLALAIWGALLGTGVAVKDGVRQYVEARPVFYVRTQVEITGADSKGTPTGRFRIRIANVGAATATLEPVFYLLVVPRTRDGNTRQLRMAFSQSDTKGIDYIPGHPPTLKTGEEASAVTETVEIGDAANSLEYLEVSFELVGGRQYLAVVSDPKYWVNDHKTGELLGWSGGSVARSQPWF